MSDYAFEGPKWATNSISWSFATSTFGQDAVYPFSSAISSQYQSTVVEAMQRWSSVSGLNLTQVADSSTTNIRVGFGSLNTPSTYTVGYTSYSYTYSSAGAVFSPDVVVRLEDPAQDALISNGSGGYTYQGFSTTLYQTVLHEIGHALGLDHSTDSSAVMYASLGPSDPDLNSNDIAGIQALYSQPASTPTTTTTTTTKTAKAPKQNQAHKGTGVSDDTLVGNVDGGNPDGPTAFMVPGNGSFAPSALDLASADSPFHAHFSSDVLMSAADFDHYQPTVGSMNDDSLASASRTGGDPTLGVISETANGFGSWADRSSEAA